ncbi:hypothetical protein BAOM_3078 [Peribacillus asahii]|uniref:Uncharacterized protein n=1 Tax=Peribacillus asahii TaxID=228899 RepID=A0A3Q9RNN5_9BACI|nr:hypothetical protein [Peribacillus asahii]AZV43687.1 hypothetical protein BAOM_3078 [Peribacillus asahii]
MLSRQELATVIKQLEYEVVNTGEYHNIINNHLIDNVTINELTAVEAIWLYNHLSKLPTK